MKYVLILITAVICLSCTSEKKETTPNSIIELNPQQNIAINEQLLSADHFTVIGSSLLIIEEKLEEGKFKFFSADEKLEPKHEFGKQGSGPNEFTNFIAQPIQNISSNSVSIYDWSAKKLRSFSINTNTADFTITNTKEFTLPPQFMIAQQATFLNDSTIITVSGSSDGFVSFFNTNTGLTSYFNDLNYNISAIEDNRSSRAHYDSFVSINHSEKLIAVAPRYLPTIYIIDFEGNVVHRHSLNPDFKVNPNFDEYNDKAYFRDVTSSKNYIYAMYYGKSHNEIEEIVDNENPENYNFTKVMVFDWTGNLVKTYQLNGGLYPYISVDKNDSKIYTTNPFSKDNSGIVIFDLK